MHYQVAAPSLHSKLNCRRRRWMQVHTITLSIASAEIYFVECSLCTSWRAPSTETSSPSTTYTTYSIQTVLPLVTASQFHSLRWWFQCCILDAHTNKLRQGCGQPPLYTLLCVKPHLIPVTVAFFSLVAGTTSFALPSIWCWTAVMPLCRFIHRQHALLFIPLKYKYTNQKCRKCFNSC